MSMRNIDVTGRLESAAKVADTVHERAREVQKDLKGVVNHEALEKVAHWATMQALDEQGTELREELGQLTSVIDGPQPEPAAKALVPIVETPALAPAPVPAPVVVDEVPVPAATVRDASGRYLPNWSLLQWVLAAAGAVIGLYAAFSVYDSITNDLPNGWDTFFNIIVFVSLICAGFFGGGVLGSWIDDRKTTSRVVATD